MVAAVKMEQRRDALLIANRLRVERARVKASVPHQHHASRLFVSGLLRQPPVSLESMELVGLLNWIYGACPVRREDYIGWLLGRAGVHRARRVRDATERQRVALADLLEGVRS